jgi:hypothetical protein
LAVKGPETAVHDLGQDRFGVRLSAVDTAISLCDTLDEQQACERAVLLVDASSAAPDPPPAVARVRTRATSTA